MDPQDAEGFAALVSSWLTSEDDLMDTLHQVVQAAVRVIPGCDLAAITTRRRRELTTDASTDPLVEELDRAQYELDEGPCVDAYREAEFVVIPDTATDRRYPHWSPRAAEAGVGSVLSLHLVEEGAGVGGALNLYARETRAFDTQAIAVAQVFVANAAPAISTTRRIDGLNTALRTRHTIGVAQGMLMARYALAEAQAFQFLSRQSQDTNVKLRDVAARVIEELSREAKRRAQ